MINVLTFILGGVFVYFTLDISQQNLHQIWQTAYEKGYDDGGAVSRAEFYWSEERLRAECMLLHFDEDEEKRKRRFQ
jgi:hypothetical protein